MKDETLYSIGLETKLGKITGYKFDGYERYYFILNKEGSVAFMPQSSIKGLLK